MIWRKKHIRELARALCAKCAKMREHAILCEKCGSDSKRKAEGPMRSHEDTRGNIPRVQHTGWMGDRALLTVAMQPPLGAEILQAPPATVGSQDATHKEKN